MGDKKTHGASAYRDCNMVAQESIWKEEVHKETKAARQWYRTVQCKLNCMR